MKKLKNCYFFTWILYALLNCALGIFHDFRDIYKAMVADMDSAVTSVVNKLKVINHLLTLFRGTVHLFLTWGVWNRLQLRNKFCFSSFILFTPVAARSIVWCRSKMVPL